MAGQRTCIKCNSSLEPIVILGVEIDRCVNCGGIWLDGGEIRELAAKRAAAGADHELEMAIDRLSTQAPTGAAPAPGDNANVPCPACGGKLTQASFGPTAVEYCNACQGVFLDRGELARAMQAVDSNEATTIMALANSVTASGFIDR